MIARIIRGKSFGGLMRYLTAAKKALTPDHVRARHIVSVDRAAKEMSLVAAQSKRVEKPVYHLILAWAPEETPSREQQIRAAERLLELIGLDSNQAVIVVHDEAKAGLVPGAEGRHFEAHICVNRVRFDGAAVKLNHDYRRVEIATFQIAEEMGFRQVAGRFNNAQALDKPGLGDAVGSIKAQSGERTIADEIREDAVRFDALRRARRSGWAALITEFRRQGIALMPGPPPRRADLERGIVMVDLKEPERRLKISALDSSSEKWGAGALAKEFGPIPLELLFTVQTLPANRIPIESAPQAPAWPKDGLYQQFLAENEKALMLRGEMLKRHALERSQLIQSQRNERNRHYANAKRRRKILFMFFGRRSLLRRALNVFFDVMLKERHAEIRSAYDRCWADLRQRHSQERVRIPRWAEWRRGEETDNDTMDNLRKYRRGLSAGRPSVSSRPPRVETTRDRPHDHGR